jgi:hypothetical protein
MINADIDPAFVGGNVVHTEWRNLPLVLDDKVMNAHRFGLTFGTERTARVFKVPDQLLFLGIHRDSGLTGASELFDKRIDMLELRVAIRMLATLPRFGIRL